MAWYSSLCTAPAWVLTGRFVIYFSKTGLAGSEPDRNRLPRDRFRVALRTGLGTQMPCRSGHSITVGALPGEVRFPRAVMRRSLLTGRELVRPAL